MRGPTGSLPTTATSTTPPNRIVGNNLVGERLPRQDHTDIVGRVISHHNIHPPIAIEVPSRHPVGTPIDLDAMKQRRVPPDQHGHLPTRMARDQHLGATVSRTSFRSA